MMHTRAWCTTILLTFLSLALFGQTKEKIVIEGIVVDRDSAHALPSVHLRIPNTSLGGVTGANGRFKTRVYPDDSVIFSSVGYQHYLLTLTDSTTQSRRMLVIRMVPQVTILNEVKVRNYIDITKYIKYKVDSTVDMRRSHGTPLFKKAVPRERKAVQLSAGPGGAKLEGAVTAIANLFSDEFQQKKKLRELQETEEARLQQQALAQEMIDRYQALVRDATEIDTIELQRFTSMYMPPPLAMVGMSDYEVTAGIVQNLKKYASREVFLQNILKNGSFEGQENQP